MREIIFRGKRLDNGEWVYGAYCAYDSKFDYDKDQFELNVVYAPSIIAYDDECLWHRVDPATVGQYTGLTDKNGKRIFEGDIVEVVSINNDHGQQGAISILCVRYIMGNSCACYPVFESGTPLYPLLVGCSIKVIGNIHDNRVAGRRCE